MVEAAIKRRIEGKHQTWRSLFFPMMTSDMGVNMRIDEEASIIIEFFVFYFDCLC